MSIEPQDIYALTVMEEGENGREFSAGKLFITGVSVEKIETLVFRSIGQCNYSGETTMQRDISVIVSRD